MEEIPSNAIGKAIEKWVTELPWEGEEPRNEGMLGDWLAIACFVSVDGEGRPNAQYYIAMKDGTLLPHVAHGLLTQAEEELPSMRED
jgi:hypothetical protein